MSIRPLLLKLGDYRSLNLQLIQVSSNASLLRNRSGRCHAVLTPPSGDNSNAYALRTTEELKNLEERYMNGQTGENWNVSCLSQFV